MQQLQQRDVVGEGGVAPGRPVGAPHAAAEGEHQNIADKGIFGQGYYTRSADRVRTQNSFTQFGKT